MKKIFIISFILISLLLPNISYSVDTYDYNTITAKKLIYKYLTKHLHKYGHIRIETRCYNHIRKTKTYNPLYLDIDIHIFYQKHLFRGHK